MCSVYTIILAIDHTCPVLSCSLDAWEVPASGTVRLAAFLASRREQGATPGPEVVYMRKGGQKSILTDFYSDRQLKFKRNQCLEQQLPLS